MIVFDLIILALLLLASAFFSATETAFAVVNKLKMEIKARKDNLAARVTTHFNKSPEKFYSTVLIGNHIVNIGFASLVTYLLFLAGYGEWYILLISSAFLLIFGELLPRSIARENPDPIMYIFIVPIKWLSSFLAPVHAIISWIIGVLTGQRKLNETVYQNYFEKEEIEDLVNESREEGSVGEEEGVMINKVLMLRNQKVIEAMRPRTEIIGIEADSTVEEALELFIESGFSKLPVYEENLDHIKGVIKAYDMFNYPARLEDIRREVLFVPEARKSIDMLSDFLNSGLSFAVVVDEFGGTAGIVTMEDIVEELFGEIKDEYDTEEDICRKVNNNTLLVNGKIEIDFLNERFNLEIPEGEYETVSGFITAHIGRIPEQNEEIPIGNFHIHVIRITSVKIELVKISVPHDIEENV